MAKWFIGSDNKWKLLCSSTKWQLGTAGDPCGCTYRQARRCSDNVLADVWMTIADATAVGTRSFKFQTTCYYFADAPSTIHGTVVSLANVTLFPSCSECLGVGPCLTCQTGTTRSTAIVSMLGWAACCKPLGAAASEHMEGVDINGSWTLHQAAGNPCNYRNTFPMSGAFWTYLTSTGCTGPRSLQGTCDTLTVELAIFGGSMSLTFSLNFAVVQTVFANTIHIGSPIDCSLSRSFPDNETDEDGNGIHQNCASGQTDWTGGTGTASFS